MKRIKYFTKIEYYTIISFIIHTAVINIQRFLLNIIENLHVQEK